MKRVKWIAIGAAVLVAAVVAAYLIGRSAPRGAVQAESETSGRIISESTTITGEIIRSGLNDIGELATEEYYFTQVETYDSTKSAQLFNITFDLPLTRTKFIYSYDGVIKAGVDFTKIEVEKDDLKRVITVTLPKSYILSTEIDFDSFELYDEQQSIFNPVSVKDVNDTNRAMVQTAEKDALAKGLLERADKNAETLIKNFLRGGYDVREYAVRIERKS